MPVDYHAWTHRPKALGGTDPIELTPACFKAWQSIDFDAGVGQSISNGTSTILTWDLWSNSNAAVFDIQGQTTSITTVRLIPWGRYSFHCILWFQDNFAASVSVGMSITGYGTWNIGARTMDFAATTPNAGGLVFHDEVILPLPDLANSHAAVSGSSTPTDDITPNVGVVEFKCSQSSGISRLTGAGTEMMIQYHGPEPAPGELQGSGAP